MQVLIVWQSDLPNEARWYVVRSTGGWGIAAALVAGGHFILPFFALLSPWVQRSRSGIACVTALLILSEIIRGWWLVVPASGQSFGLVDVLAMLGLTGIAAALALRAPHRRVRSGTRRRSPFISAPILVLLPPRRVYHDSAGLRRD
jgi:hypothetical protein